ncbi:hypothetical protein CEUSTIGMA_g9018.t1 [Chlamydomonas eustigma]|uniref:Uncharacterized protein n=1 Tax=Chlamydomonas eustigma TaxID=1157962 RepID=A0A250XFM4_9CHLO|nr:hypothetical protein CEUSTIGMA_g9018.t1 [Chlamydomonas eustigma]|eukprot:GAX81590.1 hypothetical protein CEUSTIGMA_g9018.t1 [Chlamydomonas eustigma]
MLELRTPGFSKSTYRRRLGFISALVLFVVFVYLTTWRFISNLRSLSALYHSEAAKEIHAYSSGTNPSLHLPPQLLGWKDDIMQLEQLNWEARHAVSASLYTLPEGPVKSRAAVFRRIQNYVKSADFKLRQARITESNLTGIIIPAGGRVYNTNALVTLRVLRINLRCRLPVELMWLGAGEGSKKRWRSIERLFSPIRGVDLTKERHPVPGLHRSLLFSNKFLGKVFSLLVSEFRHVLMVDADSLPIQSPDSYFKHPQYGLAGNVFWPDAWQGEVRDEVLVAHGLNPETLKDVLNAGKSLNKLVDPSCGTRDTESGQLLFDRAKHLDVLEYLLWINSYAAENKKYLWGDKDTYSLAFAVAGKAHLYFQVEVPPAALLTRRPEVLQIKCPPTCPAPEAPTWGYELLGFLQHDSWGRPAFLHRIINKYSLASEPWPIHVITAPMTVRWASYFLNPQNSGPTRGLHSHFVVPASSFTLLSHTNTLPWLYQKAGLSRVPKLTTGESTENEGRGNDVRGEGLLDTSKPEAIDAARLVDAGKPLEGTKARALTSDGTVVERPAAEKKFEEPQELVLRNERQRGLLSVSGDKMGQGDDMTAQQAGHDKGVNKVWNTRAKEELLASCPVASFISTWSMRSSGLAIDDLEPEQVVQTCQPILQSVLGNSTYEQYKSMGWLAAPMLRYMMDTTFQRDSCSRDAVDKGQHHQQQRSLGLSGLAAFPLPAWRVDSTTRQHEEEEGSGESLLHEAVHPGRTQVGSAGAASSTGGEGHFQAVLSCSQDAYRWVQRNAGMFDVQQSWIGFVFHKAAPQWPVSNFIFR